MNHRSIKIFWKIPFGGLWQGTPGSHETAESGKRILNLQKTCRKPAGRRLFSVDKGKGFEIRYRHYQRSRLSQGGQVLSERKEEWTGMNLQALCALY